MGVMPESTFRLDSLEPRRLFAVTAAVDGAGVLRVAGDDAANAIRVSASNGAIDVSADGESLGAFAGVASVEVDGGAGNDQLSLAAGVTVPVTLSGGEGDDTLLALSPATLSGGDGTDAFWAGKSTHVTLADASAVEAKRGVNRLPDVFSSAPVTTAKTRGVGTSLKDPKLTKLAISVASFAGNPLFSDAGPSQSDIKQGQLNDCYLLASLGSVATTDPSLIYNTITSLGDGTYAVRVMHGRTAKYYEVNADLPTTYGSSPAYAGLGQDGALWVALVEKAFALDKGGSYAKLDTGGWMGNVYKSLGLGARTAGATAFTAVAAALASGDPVTVATKKRQSSVSSLVSNHAYTVRSIQLDSKGHLVSMTLVNPWGLAGTGVGDVMTIGATDAKGLSAFALAVV